MTDTPSEIEQRFHDMMLARSGEDRLKMGCSMHTMAQALVRAYGEDKDTPLAPNALRRMMFLRFYGHEFNSETSKKILMSLENLDDT